MMKRFDAALLSGLALAVLGAGPVVAATKKPMTHHAKAQSKEMMTTDQLNAQSLAAAQQGKPFMPMGAASTPAANPAPAQDSMAKPKKM